MVQEGLLSKDTMRHRLNWRNGIGWPLKVARLRSTYGSIIKRR